MTNLPCLSIRQPWLYCITDGDKRTENRTWKPPSGLIGKRIGLHASITLSRQDVPAAARLMRANLHHADLFTRGAIVATARLAGYVRVDGRDRYDIDHAPKHYWPATDRWLTGPFGWILEDVRLIRPVYVRGNQGIWYWSGELVEREAVS